MAGVADDRILLLLSRRHRDESSAVAPFAPTEVIAARIVDISDLAADQWPVIGYGAVPRISVLPAWPPQPDTPADDPALIEAFVNACLGLYPWDGFGAPDVFANMLLSPGTRPAAARLAREMGKA